MNSLEVFLIAVSFVLVFILWVVLYPRQRLMVTDRGICDRALRLGWIRWNDIEGAYRPGSLRGDGVRLRVRSESGDPVEIDLDLTETEYSSVDLLREIVARKQ